MNVPAIRRRMHLAFADLDEKALAATQWPEIKYLLELWDADRDAVSQVAVEREQAWNKVDRYREQLELARAANALLAEELAVARGRLSRSGPMCQPGACDTRLGRPDLEAGISHVRECEHGRVFVWEDSSWHAMPVEGEEGWKPASLAAGGERARHIGDLAADLRYWEAACYFRNRHTGWLVRPRQDGKVLVNELTEGEAAAVVECHNAEVRSTLGRLNEWAKDRS